MSAASKAHGSLAEESSPTSEVAATQAPVQPRTPDRRRGRLRSLDPATIAARRIWKTRFRDLLKRNRRLTSAYLAEAIVARLSISPGGLIYPVTKVTVDKWRAMTEGENSALLVPKEAEATALVDVLREEGAFPNEEERNEFLTPLGYSSDAVTEASILATASRLVEHLSGTRAFGFDGRKELTREDREQVLYVAACLLTQHAREVFATPNPDKIVILRSFRQHWGNAALNKGMAILKSEEFKKYLHEQIKNNPKLQVRVVIAMDGADDWRVSIGVHIRDLKLALQKIGDGAASGDNKGFPVDVLGFSLRDNDGKNSRVPPHADVWLQFFNKPRRVEGWSIVELDFLTVHLAARAAGDEPQKRFTLSPPLSAEDREYYITALATHILDFNTNVWEWRRDGGAQLSGGS